MKFASKFKMQIPLALGLSLISSYSLKLPAYSSDQANATPSLAETTAIASPTMPGTVAIRNIYANADKQLVIEFDNPNHINPAEPQVRDYPGLKHDIVLEFSQTSFAVDKAPKAKALLDELMKVYPDLNSVSYATAVDGTRVRIRIGVSPSISSHPVLAKVDQNYAIINLDLPEINKSALAPSRASVVDQTKIADASKTTPDIITATNVPVKESADKSVTAKTVDGIKGAWSSGFKKVNPLSKFGHKSANHLSAPANSDIASTSATDVKPEASVEVKKVAETTAVEQSSPNTDLTVALKTALGNAAPTTVLATPAAALPATVAPALSAVAISPDVSKSDLKPEITAAEIAALSSAAAVKTDQASALAINPVIEKSPAGIPAAVGASEEAKVADESLIAPLPIDQVLKDKALSDRLKTDNALAHKPAAAVNEVPVQPVTEQSTTDTGVTSDMKTGFSQPVSEKADKKELADKAAEDAKQEDAKTKEAKKEEADKVASVPPNPLDSLTSAAITNAATEPAAEESNQTPTTAVKLRTQKAHVGGKDYFPPKFDGDAVDHYNAAVRAHLNGNLAEAITEYKEAIEADEKIAEAYSNLGLIYNQQHKYDLAMVEFHKALAMNPKDAITYNGIGAAMRAKNNLLAAIKNWQAAIAIDPNLASAHYNLGTAYEINKDFEKALAQYKEAVKHDDKLGEAFYRMGLILQKMNNKNLALEEYKQAVKISQQASYATDAKRRINLLSQTKSPSM